MDRAQLLNSKTRVAQGYRDNSSAREMITVAMSAEVHSI